MKVLILLFIAYLSVVRAYNACGGDRVIDESSLGEYCDCRIGNDCPFGIIKCSTVDGNSLACVPNCTITVKEILDLAKTKNEAIMIPTCEHGGIYDISKAQCVCPAGYLGIFCELLDMCYNIDCNNKGVCEKGQCLCDVHYMGSRCEIRRDCRTNNVQWTGTNCVCAKGWAGINCDQCVNSSVCLPDPDLMGYTLVSISDQILREAILTTPPPPQYNNARPYQPTPLKYQCKCAPQPSIVNLAALVEHFAPSAEPEHRLTSYGMQRDFSMDDDDIHPYIGHFYNHRRHNICDDDDADGLVGVWIFFIFLLVIIGSIYFCCTPNQYASKTSSKLSSTPKRMPSGAIPF